MAPLTLLRLRKLHDRFLLSMITKPELPTKVIFDLDSTVLILYGKQEMARIGYNPQKWGRPSYHPLLCFNGITKDFWHGELRPGDTHTAAGVVELLKALNTGMRLSEILGLTWKGVDLFRKTLTVFKSKNGEKRTIPMNATVFEMLKDKSALTTRS